MSYITAISCKEFEGASYVGGAGPMTRLMESGHSESITKQKGDRSTVKMLSLWPRWG